MEKGNKYGSLTFIEFSEKKHNRKYGLFICDCGKSKNYDVSAVKHGRPRQCISCARTKFGNNKHGLIRHPLYRKWQDLKNRCYNKKTDRYANYGNRGIKVCKEWKNNFKNFYDWSIKNGWKQGLEIDRIDVNGNYEPSNCRYITHLKNGFNKTNTFYITVNENRIALCEFLYINNKSDKYHIIWNGLNRGKDIEYYIKKFGLINGAERS